MDMTTKQLRDGLTKLVDGGLYLDVAKEIGVDADLLYRAACHFGHFKRGAYFHTRRLP